MKKILIADDDRELARALECWLERKYEVVVAHSNHAAKEAAMDNVFDVILLDTGCLGEGAVVEALRSLCPNCKIVLFSGGVIGDEDPAQFGVDMVLPRVDPAVLIIRLSELLCEEVEQ